MEPLDAIESLARRARLEAAPATDVDAARLIRAVRVEPMRLVPLAWTAAAAAIAASVVLAMALRANVATADPVSSLFTPTQLEMP